MLSVLAAILQGNVNSATKYPEYALITSKNYKKMITYETTSNP